MVLQLCDLQRPYLVFRRDCLTDILMYLPGMHSECDDGTTAKVIIDTLTVTPTLNLFLIKEKKKTNLLEASQLRILSEASHWCETHVSKAEFIYS